MNTRLSLQEIATRVQAQIVAAFPTVRVDTGFAPDYLAAFAQTWPAVWIMAQRATPTGDNKGYPQFMRQHFSVDIAVRLVTQRYANGETSATAEAKVVALQDAVISALLGWQPTGADHALSIGPIQDGPVFEAVSITDVIFVTGVTYTRSMQ